MGMGEYVEPSHVDISLRLPCDKYFMSMLYMFASTASTFETDRTVVGEHCTCGSRKHCMEPTQKMPAQAQTLTPLYTVIIKSKR